MNVPKETGLPSNFVAKQVRCVYGTRDAEAMAFTSGKASPCCFYHPIKGVSIVVHGDDFTTLGLDHDLDWYESELAKNFELKLRGRLGEGCKGDNQLRILNRIVTITESGITYEADEECRNEVGSDRLISEIMMADTPTKIPGRTRPPASSQAARHHHRSQPFNPRKRPSNERCLHCCSAPFGRNTNERHGKRP